MSVLPTVKVTRKSHPKGYVLINEADYNPEEHELYSEEKPKAKPKKKRTYKKKKAKKDD